MEIIKCWEELGEMISAPYKRKIKIMLAPDVRNCEEITFSHAILYPHSQTDYHGHNRPELILILSGFGVVVCDEKEIPVKSDMALWVRAGEEHKLVNKSDETMKLATVFIPAYTSEELLGPIKSAARNGQKEEASS